MQRLYPCTCTYWMHIWAKSVFYCCFAFECLEYGANMRVRLWSPFSLESFIIRASGTIFFKVEIVRVGRSDSQMSCLCVSSVAEEKKSLKRTFQQIQEEEDDDYPGSYSPQDPSAGPLLVRWEQHWGTSRRCSHEVELPTTAFHGDVRLGLEKSMWNGTSSFFVLECCATPGWLHVV